MNRKKIKSISGLIQLPRKSYVKYFMLPKSNEIYFFRKACFDRFAITPDSVFSYKEGYLAFWRHFGSGAITGSDRYATVIIRKTKSKSLYGHIRCPRVLESKKDYKKIEKNYYLCAVDHTLDLNVSSFFLDLINKMTQDFSISGWNFVFYNGIMAIYFDRKKIDIAQAVKIYDNIQI